MTTPHKNSLLDTGTGIPRPPLAWSVRYQVTEHSSYPHKNSFPQIRGHTESIDPGWLVDLAFVQ